MENLKNLRDLKLRNKFNGFSGALIIALLFTGILSLVIMRELKTGTTAVSVNWLPSVIIAEELNTATSDFRIAETSHVISQDDKMMAVYEERISLISADIETMFQNYEEKLITNEVDRALVADARSLWEDYLTIHEEMIYFSKDNNTDAAMKIMANESETLFNEVSNVFLELVTFNKEGADLASEQGDNIYSNSMIIILGISAVSVFIFRMFRVLMGDIEEAQEKLAHAHEEALLSSQAKSNFLANMSHEIRTPMNAISGMTDIILRETTDQEISENAYAIKRACDSLLSIINDVLDISKIESGKLEIVEAEYKLSNVLNDVLTIASNRIEHKNLMFATEFQQDLPDILIGDEVRVKQIMVNILNNAIKFTHEGHVSFDVRGEFADGQLNLSFSVTDTGVGIGQEDVERLFVEFERVNTKKNRSIEGTGLGLAISKRLCGMMGGNIQVESEIGKGTTFTINIIQKYKDYVPLAQVQEKKSVLIFESRELYLRSIERSCKQLSLRNVVCCALQSELSESLSEQEFDFVFTSAMYHYKVQEILLKRNLNSKIVLLADNSDIKMKYDYTTILLPAHSISIANVLNGKATTGRNDDDFTHFVAPSCKVLVVDDNLVNLKVAQGLMKPYRFEIDTAENGEEAVRKIKRTQYDMVFMDHMMPVMDGIDATIAVRALEEEYYKNLPIVALTANAIVGTEEMFIKEGMNDFLAKPIKLKALNEVLARWLPKQAQIYEGTQENTSDPAIVNTKVTPPGESKELVISGINIDLGVKRTGDDFESYISILELYYKDGIKRIPIVSDYYDKKLFQEYKVEVHALKSASASIGALNVSEKARMLEEACNGKDWIYVNQNNSEFMDDFNILLENIREALKGIILEEDESAKEGGDNSLYRENLVKLKEALDNVDINLCDQLLQELMEFQWDKTVLDNITKVKDFVSVYEYDEAIEYIDQIIADFFK